MPTLTKKYFFSIFLLAIASCSNDDTPKVEEIPSTTISSASFEQALIHIGIDSDGILNGRISNNDVSAITYLPLNDQNISDLSGIENFSGLKKLDCFNNQLTSLDVSQNTALKELDFHNNRIASIDVSQNTALASLLCFDNQLISLDVGQNTLLATLGCTNNQLTSLDVDQNTVLTQLYCSQNQLTSIDVRQNTLLRELFCFSNRLTSLDLSQNTALLELYPYDNLLTSLNVKNGNNSILTKFNSTGNNDLLCIQIDKEIDANESQAPYNVWLIDITSAYLEDCDIP